MRRAALARGSSTIRFAMNDIIQTIAVYAIPVIFAITLHEAAHGYVARMLGDPTAYQAGRVSLNPARHIDPVGTLLVPVAIGGTWLGRRLLRRLPQERFRQLALIMVFGIGLLTLIQALRA